MKSVKAESHPPEFQRFDAAIGKLLALPRDVYQKRLEEWKASPGARGPKVRRKVKQPPVASHDPAV